MVNGGGPAGPNLNNKGHSPYNGKEGDSSNFLRNLYIPTTNEEGNREEKENKEEVEND